jgi:ech hydrogenase subunit F
MLHGEVMRMPSMFGESFGNLFKKPATQIYPAEKYEPIERTRGRYEMDIKKCIFCGLCEKACPANVIKVDKAGKRHITITSGCILCYRCADVCPKDCISFREQYAPPTSGRTAFIHEILPAGSRPPEGAVVEQSEPFEGGTAYAYTLVVEKPKTRAPR